jgi:serine/threonine protein kinase
MARADTDPKRRARRSPPTASGRGRANSDTGSGEREKELPDDDKLIGRVLGGKFRLDALLGEGAMGRIYVARQLLLDKDVAIKVLHQHLGGEERVARRFHREAKAASRLSHTNSVQILDFGGTDDGVLYIAMEYLDGEDLQIILDHDHPFSCRRIGNILGQTLRAIDEAHHAGIIHRDLKPENILVQSDRHGNDIVKVCDFGIAKILEGEGQSITVDGFVCGTPQYMAPEQARGEDVDARLDIYAAGIVLYQMLTGVPPFTGETALGIITKHLTDDPVPPRKKRPDLGIPASLEAIALKAMSKNRNDRYASAGEMADVLEAAIGALGAEANVRLGDGVFAERAKAAVAIAQSGTLEVPRSEASIPVAPAASESPWKWAALLGAFAIVGAAAWAFWPAPIAAPPSAPQAPSIQPVAMEPPVPVEPIIAPTIVAPVVDPVAEPVAADPIVQPTTTERPAAASDPRPRARPETSPTTPVTRTTPPTVATQTPAPAAASPFEEGRRAFLAQNFSAAIQAFEQVTRETPGNAEAHKQLARSLMRAGQVPRAVTEYRRYLELSPNAADRTVIESIIEQNSH